jgi:beta-galactosidase
MIANVKLCDSKGRFVPAACQDLVFEVPEGYRILGWGNGDPAFQHIERPVVTGTFVPDSAARTVSIRTFNGLAQVVLQKK